MDEQCDRAEQDGAGPARSEAGDYETGQSDAGGDRGAVGRVERGGEEQAGWGIEHKDVTRREHQVGERADAVAQLADPAREPREQCCLGGPCDRECPAAEQQRERDRGDGEADRPEQGRELAVATEPAGREAEEHCGYDEQRGAFPVDAGELAVQQRSSACSGQCRRADDQRRRERVRACRGAHSVADDAHREEQEPEEGRHEHDAHRCALAGVEHEPRKLRDGGEHAGDQQVVPAPPNRHDGGPGQDDAGEGGPDRSQPAVEGGGDGNKGGADQSDRRDRLGAPGERNRRSDRGDSGCDRQRRHVWHEPVERRRGEQCGVSARDARADGGHCRVELAVAAAHLEPAREDEQRRQRAEAHPLSRPDPAAVDRQDEEEDDAERRHDAARPGQGAGAEQVGELDLELGAGGTSRFPQTPSTARFAGSACGARRGRAATRRTRRRWWRSGGEQPPARRSLRCGVGGAPFEGH